MSKRVATHAPQRWFPPIMPREEFLKTDYVRSFPDLVGSIDVFTGGDKEHRALLEVLEAGGDWTAHLTPAEVVLPSSVCHPLYGNLPHDIPAEGLDEECSGWSFRHEPSLDPARMQIFRIYEFVRIGTPEQSLAHRDEWLERGLAALTRARAAGPVRGRQRPVLRPGRQDAGRQPARLVAEVRDVRSTSPRSGPPRSGPPTTTRTTSATPSTCTWPTARRRTAPASASGSTGSRWPCSPRTALDLEAWPEEVRSALACSC